MPVQRAEVESLATPVLSEVFGRTVAREGDRAARIARRLPLPDLRTHVVCDEAGQQR